MSRQLCPDNSTECLLRALIDQSSGYNWNPLNFAFTAAIGALALIIACVTVFQGLLAAGPGRLKANENAIGNFASKSVSRFSWTEFGLRTTAFTPLLTWTSINNYVDKKRDPTLWKRNNRKSSPDTTATWLSLLTNIGLDDPSLFELIPRATDYLPADVQAAPAAAEVRCLTLLAVIADQGTAIDPGTAPDHSTRFLRVNGDKSQLSYRDHPALGRVAAYESYSVSLGQNVYQRLTPSEFGELWRFATGSLTYARRTIPQGVYSFMPQHRPRANPWVKSLQVEQDGLTYLLSNLSERSKGCSHDLCGKLPNMWHRHIGRFPQRELRGFLPIVTISIALMNGAITPKCRAFPHKHFRIQQCLRHLSHLSMLLDADSPLEASVQSLGMDFIHQNIPEKQFRFQFQRAGWASAEAKEPVSGLAQSFMEMDLDSARVWLQDQLSPQPQLTTDPMPQSGYALQRLNTSLSHSTGPDASCVMFQLISELIKDYRAPPELPITDSIRRMVAELNSIPTPPDLERDKGFEFATTATNTLVDPPGDQMPASDDITAVKLSPKQLMRNFIVLRGVLFAKILLESTDTSPVFEKDFRDSIVKVL